MILNKKLLAAAVAGLSMLAASSAQASPNNNPNKPELSSNAASGSDLLLTVWDQNTNTSYNQILEVNGSSSTSARGQVNFLANNSFPTESLSGSHWSSFYNSISAGDTVTYSVESAYKTATSQTINPGFTTTEADQASNGSGAYANSAAVLAGLNGIVAGTSGISNIQSYSATLDNYFNLVQTGLGTTSSSGNDAYSSGSGTSLAWDASVLGYNVGGNLGINDKIGVAVGQAADFYYATNNGTTGAASVLGQWDLSINGSGVGSLTYTANTVSAVPVPAAAWMMLSGLMGVLSVTRRKKAA